jgi:hypothetical protein
MFKAMDIFNQNRFFHKRSVEFKEDGIIYSTGNLLGSQTIFFPYEEIQYEKIAREFKTDKFNFWLAAASGLVTIKSIAGFIKDPEGLYKGLLPLASIFFVVFSIATLLSRKRLLYITTFTSGAFELFDNNPSDIEIENFLKNLKRKTNEYLKVKYGSIDKDLPIENQLQNLVGLKQRKILSDAEFEELKIQLTGSRSEVKGFNSKS